MSDVAYTRFGLRNGQFFAYYKYKNLHWHLDGVHIGYGDLRESDILHIQSSLQEDEQFVGWNEHHGSEFQQTDLPLIIVTKDLVKHRSDIIEEERQKAVRLGKDRES